MNLTIKKFFGRNSHFICIKAYHYEKKIAENYTLITDSMSGMFSDSAVRYL